MPKIKQAKPIIQMNVADMAILAFQGRLMHAFLKTSLNPKAWNLALMKTHGYTTIEMLLPERCEKKQEVFFFKDKLRISNGLGVLQFPTVLKILVFRCR